MSSGSRQTIQSPYKALLGLVYGHGQVVAQLSGVPGATVTVLREAFGLEPAARRLTHMRSAIPQTEGVRT